MESVSQTQYDSEPKYRNPVSLVAARTNECEVYMAIDGVWNRTLTELRRSEAEGNRSD